MKKLDRSPKHAKILQSFLHVSSQAIVDRGDLSGDWNNTLLPRDPPPFTIDVRSEYLNTHEK